MSHMRNTDNETRESYDKVFKDEAYIKYLMKNYKDEFYNKQIKQSYIQYIQDIKDKNLVFKDRGTEGVYMSHQVFEDWIFFCDSIPKKTCELTEKALLLFMLNYPKKDILIDLNLQEVKQKNSQQRLQESVLCNNLKVWMDRVFTHTQNGELDKYPECWNKFTEYAEEASKFNNPSLRLEKLIEQAVTLI